MFRRSDTLSYAELLGDSLFADHDRRTRCARRGATARCAVERGRCAAVSDAAKRVRHSVSDRRNGPGAEHVEVQLHVSENRGAAWHLVAKARPDEGRFSYKAARDGELWFLVRTLNRQGRLLPEKPFAPELRVLVDTDPPLLELLCKRGAAGEIDCSWKTSDPI